MASVTEQKVNSSMQKLCEKILDFDYVRFVGIIDKMGNLIEDRFRDGVVPFENDAKRRMLYMQMVLEILMRRDFDSSLGPIDYVASHRKKGLMISIPFNEYVIVMSGEPALEIQKILSKINGELENNYLRSDE